LRLFSFGGYGLALPAFALIVFGAIECPLLKHISSFWCRTETVLSFNSCFSCPQTSGEKVRLHLWNCRNSLNRLKCQRQEPILGGRSCLFRMCIVPLRYWWGQLAFLMGLPLQGVGPSKYLPFAVDYLPPQFTCHLQSKSLYLTGGSHESLDLRQKRNFCVNLCLRSKGGTLGVSVGLGDSSYDGMHLKGLAPNDLFPHPFAFGPCPQVIRFKADEPHTIFSHNNNRLEQLFEFNLCTRIIPFLPKFLLNCIPIYWSDNI